jgi:hypothetical protein
MEQIIGIIISLIAISSAILGIYSILPKGTDFGSEYNAQAIDILAEKSRYACSVNQFSGITAAIRVSSGTDFYFKDNRICYRSSDEAKCRNLICNATDFVFLNLSNEKAIKAFDMHDFRCNVMNIKGNLTINCTG